MERFITNILDQMSGVGRPKKIIVTLFLTILLMRGKVNFPNLSRYSDYCEKTYTRHYRRTFAFVEFNRRLVNEIVPADHELMGVMDCSFIPKSGKETYGLGNFYNSSQDKATKGLELSLASRIFRHRAIVCSWWQVSGGK